jgi:DNA-binding MarR family transcriptional regulator
MEKNTIDSIIDNLFIILPFIHRKLLRIDFEGVNKNISRLHFAIMDVVNQQGRLPMSEIGKRLFLPKPQMTHLIGHLIELGIVERQPDSGDRRIINIILTDTGKTALGECKRLVRDNIRQKLDRLQGEQLTELSILLKRLRELGSSLDQGEKASIPKLKPER